MFKFEFKKPLYKNFNKLYFKKNDDIIYYDNSHKTYIYSEIIKENENDIKYTFYGFFKDDFFVIIFDSFNSQLNINIEHKFIILIKMKWILNKITNIDLEPISVWELDTSEIYKNKEVFVLNVRKKILNQKFINIDDFIKIYEYTNISVNINYLTDLNQDYGFSIFRYLKCLSVQNEES
jgi:hypothetical protein